MTLPPVIRIFFAIELPLSIKETVGRFISTLKKKSKSHGIRWVKPENLHITLHFLAEVQAEHLPMLVANVRKEVVGKHKESYISLHDVHLFPNPYRPRVIVLEITPQDDLALLAESIGKGIKATQYEIDPRPFRGHLTIGRIKHAQGVNLSFLSELETLNTDKIMINEVVLFRSEPQQDGSIYTALERIAF